MEFPNKYNLPPRLGAMVERELDSSEQVEWVGQPNPGRLAAPAIGAVLFGIPWTAFAIFWTASAWGMTAHGSHAGLSSIFALCGVPFILVGLGLLTAPYWMRRWAKGIAYVLTDRRALIISLGFRANASVRSFELEGLADLRRRERADGSGDLILTNDVTAGRGRNYATAVGFMGIRDVKEVEDRVRRLVQQCHHAEAR